MGGFRFGGYARPGGRLIHVQAELTVCPQPLYGGNGYGNTPPDPYTVMVVANEPIPTPTGCPRAIVGTIFGALFLCKGRRFRIIGQTKASNAANKF